VTPTKLRKRAQNNDNAAARAASPRKKTVGEEEAEMMVYMQCARAQKVFLK